MLKEDLMDCGLSRQEVQVYLSLLKLGTASVWEIAQNARTDRSYTYTTLESLERKGLTSRVTASNKRLFHATDPSRLVHLLKEKQAKVGRLVSDLKKVYKGTIKKPKIEVFIGKEGLKTVLDDFIETKKEILIYGSTQKQLKLFRYYFLQNRKKRIKERIRIKVITEKSKESLEIHKTDLQELRQMRFLPAELEFPTATNIYGNKVAILSLENDLIGVIIENEAIANTHRIIFNLLWNISSPIQK